MKCFYDESGLKPCEIQSMDCIECEHYYLNYDYDYEEGPDEEEQEG